MFCPKCGKENQTVNSYCRNCGIYLPDFNQLSKKVIAPEEHIKANTVLTFMSGIISLIFAILLHLTFTGKEGTPILVYLVIGFLSANFFWQAQTFWRTRLLKKHLPKKNNQANSENSTEFQLTQNKYSTDKLLNESNFDDFVPASVTENTTKHLHKIRQESSQSKH